MAQYKIHNVDGTVEMVSGTPVDGTPFFVHCEECSSGRNGWRATHEATGYAIGLGWFDEADAICSIRTWWRGVPDEVRTTIAALTDDSMDEFKAWAKANKTRINYLEIYELADFVWKELPQGGI
jgi:hypothetical protein